MQKKRAMANILDYIRWRGDLTVEQSPWNEVDSLVLSELSYMNFSEIAEGIEGITISEAAYRYFESGRHNQKNTGDLYKENYFELLQLLAESRRFGEMRLMCYVQKLDEEIDMQFSAVAVEIAHRQLYIAFRGTDDTLLGWKEDFMMSVLPEVPSQYEAVKYLQRMNELYSGYRFYVGGHSKGGNLAVYAALHAGRRIQRKLLAIFNHDGPGFRDSVVDTPEYQNIENRIYTQIPQSSVVGLLLEHEEHYTVIKSIEKGWLQHDGFSWEVCGPGFVHLESVTKENRIADQTIRKVFAELDTGQRLQLTNALFGILEAKKNRTLTDIRQEGLKGMKEMLKAYDGLDKDTRKILQNVCSKILTESVKSYRKTREEENETAQGNDFSARTGFRKTEK